MTDVTLPGHPIIRRKTRTLMAGLPRYRPNAVGVFLNGVDRVLIAERHDVPGAWQFPQGGIDPDESVSEGFTREMREELGLERWMYTILDRRNGYRYEFPRHHRKWGEWIGQEQTYFRCRLLAPDTCIDLHQHTPEFDRWRWIDPVDFDLAWIVDFKRAVYRQVFRDLFGVHLRQSPRNKPPSDQRPTRPKTTK